MPITHRAPALTLTDDDEPECFPDCATRNDPPGKCDCPAQLPTRDFDDDSKPEPGGSVRD